MRNAACRVMTSWHHSRWDINPVRMAQQFKEVMGGGRRSTHITFESSRWKDNVKFILELQMPLRLGGRLAMRERWAAADNRPTAIAEKIR
jgi:hypothetical protein